MPEEEYLTIEQVSEMTNIGVSTLRTYERDRTGPPRCEITPKMIRYNKTDVIKWMNNHKKKGTNNG